ncbi:MAG: hypothetical protein NW223_20810 [Hyphomicrobiaceae bacterium]|nr:hypothetical protein [Hyphomicrobiaceae bacterium]
MSDAAGTQNLEDILASIRRSLADENVDGLVQLSAAAAAAARAGLEETPRVDAALVQALSAEDTLRQRLAGALAADELAEDAAPLEAAPGAISEIFGMSAPARDDAPEAPVAPAPALSKLWVLRPGAPEESAEASDGAPSLQLDPFADRADAAPAGDGAASIFALSARAIVGGEVSAPAAPAPPAPAPAAAEPAARRDVPRLDAGQMEMLNKLKASSAAAVASITSDDDTLVGPVLPPAPVADAEADAQATAPVANLAQALSETSVGDEPRAEAASELPASLLMRPARATPLFVGAYDNSRPIVSSPPLPGVLPSPPPDAGVLPSPEPEAPPAKSAEETLRRLFVKEAPAAPPAASPEDDLEQVLETPSAAAAEPPAPVAAPVASTDPAPVAPDAAALEAITAMAAASAAPADGEAPVRPLEEMIAAVLEPVMQRLMENSLGPLIETLVRKEVEKALQDKREA